MVTPATQQEKVLIIEDQADECRILEQSAIAFGFTVEVCASSVEGWTAYEKEAPRLVIVEGHLPHEAGLTLCQRIRESARGAYCTILMVANRDQAMNQTRALMAGASYCMDRPIRESAMAEWLAVAKRGMDDLLAMEQAVAKIDHYKLELEDVNSQLEDSIARANQSAMDAEKAYIEVNQIFKTVAGGIALINKECEIMRNNETFLTMAGATPAEVKSKKCFDIFHSCLCDTPDCPLTKIKNGAKRVESQIEKEGANGEKVYYSCVSTPFRGVVGELLGMVEHITDITLRVQSEIALKESECRYKELSIVDELTGLFNKRHFNETLRHETDRARRYGHPLSMIIMDIDNFKHFNDTYGHAEGDRVLAVMGRIVTESIRTIDRGNRYGGEEFTVILPATTGEESITVAERIRLTFAAHDFYPRGKERVNKTVSIGVTEFRADDTTESLIKRADKNLYQAKSAGKNRYILA
jgi:two-component system cell cycle response regulator